MWQGLKNKLQVLQNRAVRVITRAKFDTNSAEVLERLQWTTLDLRRDKLKSVFLYEILNEQSAPSLRQDFVKKKDLNRDYNLRSNDNQAWIKCFSSRQQNPKITISC